MNEAHLDLLLHVLDEIKLHPFYGARNRLALPQIDFDAPRLLATSYLFEADALLAHRTAGSFVRWMDDIDFGVESESAAKDLLGDLDRMLQGLNVRLNSGKTRILSAREAEKYFWITENVRINKIRTRIEKYRKSGNSRGLRRAVVALEKSASSFVKMTRRSAARQGHWEKIYKRYFGLLASTKSQLFEGRVGRVLSAVPALRSSALGYFRALGFSPARWRTVRSFVQDFVGVDEVACLEAVQVMLQWEVPFSRRQQNGIVGTIHSISSHVSRSVAAFVCGLFLLAKYGTALQLAGYCRQYEPVWRHSSWALRQVVACGPLLDVPTRRWIRERAVESGSSDAVRVLVSLRRIATMTKLDKPFRLYLLPGKPSPYGWPLSKFIILLEVAGGALPFSAKRQLLADIRATVTDPIYTARLAAIESALMP